MRSFVVLTFAALFCIAAIRDRFIAVLFYWWFAIFRPQDWIWLDVSSFRLPLIAAGLLFVGSFLQGRLPRFDHAISRLMLAFMILAVVAFLANGCNPIGPTGEAMKNVLVVLTAVLLSIRWVENEKQMLWMLFIIVASLGFYSGKGGFAALLAGGVSTYAASNLTGLFAGSNAFAMGSAVLLFPMYFFFQTCTKGNYQIYAPSWLQMPIAHLVCRYGFLVMALGTVYNVISLFSRGAALAMLAGLLLWSLLHPRRFRILVSAAVLLLVTLAFVPIPEGYRDRIASVFVDRDELDRSAAARPHFWSTAVKMTAHHPVGVGPGCYASYYDQYDSTGGAFKRARSVHSAHFQVLAELGYAGLLVWLALVLVSYRRLFAARRAALSNPDTPHAGMYVNLTSAMIAAQTVFLVAGAFYEQAYNDLIWLIFGFTVMIEKLQSKRLVVQSTASKTTSGVRQTPVSLDGRGG